MSAQGEQAVLTGEAARRRPAGTNDIATAGRDQRDVEQGMAIVRIADLVLAEAAQEEFFAGLAREIGGLTRAASVGISRFEPDGNLRSVGTWSGERRARAQSEHRVSLHCRERGRPWGEAVVADPLESHVISTTARFMAHVSPAIVGIEVRQALVEAGDRSVHAADRVRAAIAEQLRTGPRRRLVAVSAQLAAAQREVDGDRDKALALISAGRAGLAAGMDELQQLTRGIHPTLLTARGLDAALESLADTCPVDISVTGGTGRRLAESTELAAYYFIETALRRAAGDGATAITISTRLVPGVLQIEVYDDAADPTPTADCGVLLELCDRVVALGGRMTVGAGASGGSVLRARIPELIHA
jgi:signal transduction histidine kinase